MIAEELARLVALVEVGRLRQALEEIADHSRQSYDSHGPALSHADRQYQMGISDGHRCAAAIARLALGRPVP